LSGRVFKKRQTLRRVFIARGSTQFPGSSLNGFPPCATAKAKATRGRGNDKEKDQALSICFRFSRRLPIFLSKKFDW